MFVRCLAVIVLLLATSPVVGQGEVPHIDASSQTVVIFAPPEAEIGELTSRDITVQDFLSYQDEIVKRMKNELPGAALIVTENDAIVAPSRTVTRSSLHGFGFVIYCPAAGIRVYSGAMKPDDFMREAHALFEMRAPKPLPMKAVTPVRRAESYVPSYAGQWQGDVHQWFVRRYSVTMTLQQGSVGKRIGRVSYPEVPCSGVLELTGTTPTSVSLREIIESGTCLGGGTIELTTSGKNLGKWEWFDARGRSRATAKLSFIPSRVTEEPPQPVGDDTSSGSVGTVIGIDLAQRLVELRSDATGVTITVGFEPSAAFHGFGGLSGTALATDFGHAGLLKVKVGDRIQVSWSRRAGGARIAGAVTLLGRPLNTPASR